MRSLPRGDSCSLRTPVVLCSNMHRVSTEESWRQPPSQCILVSGLPPGVSAGIQREGPGRVGCLHPGVVLFLLLWMAPAVLGLGPEPAGSVEGPRGSFQLTGLALLSTGCSHQGQVLHLDLGGRMGIWTWVAGWDLAWASPCLPFCLCPAPLRAFPALVIKVGHLNLIYCLFPQFASEVWVILFTVYVWNPGRIKSNQSFSHIS